MPSPIHHLLAHKRHALLTGPCTHCGAQVRHTTSQSFTDASGNLWCASHMQRGLVLDYGHRHQWPNVTIGRYALAAGYDMWRVALALCDDAMLDAAVLAMGIVPTEEASESHA